MADLITTARAKQSINQASFTSGEDTQIGSLIDAVSAAVIRYCRRDFVSATFDELYRGDGGPRLLLRQYPILSVARVATDPSVVLQVKNTDTTTNQRATASVTSTGLTLVRVASGVTTSNTSVTWAGNATLAAVADAVNALGAGWSATAIAGHTLRASADLHYPQGAFNALGTHASFKLHTTELTDYATDAQRGWLSRGDVQGVDWYLPLVEGGIWHPEQEYRVLYTAGYATVPEDVQEACAQWVSALFWQTKDNAAAYPDLPTPAVATLLEQYRTTTLGRN